AQTAAGRFATQPGVQEAGVEAVTRSGGVDRNHRMGAHEIRLAIPQKGSAIGSQFQGHSFYTGAVEALEDPLRIGFMGDRFGLAPVGEKNSDLREPRKRATVGKPGWVPSHIERYGGVSGNRTRIQIEGRRAGKVKVAHMRRIAEDLEESAICSAIGKE